MASYEVYGRVPALALAFNMDSVGRLIASSKVRVTWHFVLNGQTSDHLVGLVHSSVSGMKQVRACVVSWLPFRVQ